MIKTFRALLGDDKQDTIRLSTNTGLIGYRIVKFRLMPNDPGGANTEHIVKIFTREQTANTTVVDFSDPTLLGAGHINNELQTSYYPIDGEVIFDHVVVNQDIFITHKSEGTVKSCNYYLELEQIKLDVNEAAVATLKDMRGSN